MESGNTNLVALRDSSLPIPATDLLEAMASSDLQTRALIMDILVHHNRRIVPAIKLDDVGEFVIE